MRHCCFSGNPIRVQRIDRNETLGQLTSLPHHESIATLYIRQLPIVQNMSQRAYPYLKIDERPSKPRSVGLTMVHDSGISLSRMNDYLETAASFLDYYKFRSMTHALYPETLLMEKIARLKQLGIKPFMGGNVAELAYARGTLEEHLEYTKQMGWEATEISETYVTYPDAVKKDLIKRSVDDDIEVFYEWGLKRPTKPLNPDDSAEDIQRYLDLGVKIAIIEEGEIDFLIGKNGEGQLGDQLKLLFDLVGPERLMVECGNLQQVGWFMKEMGTVINIGNINVSDAIEIEPLRFGIGRAVDYFIYNSTS